MALVIADITFGLLRICCTSGISGLVGEAGLVFSGVLGIGEGLCGIGQSLHGLGVEKL